MLLNGVVGQMDLWLEVVDVEFVGSSSHVALVVPVSPHHSVEVGDEHVVPDIELSIVVEHGSIDVLLDYVCPLGLLISCFALFD
jgi:hypothetical protein